MGKLTLKEVKELALYAVKAKVVTEFSAQEANSALQEQIDYIMGGKYSINNFLKNRFDIYEIVIETAAEVLPNKVISALGQFAEVKFMGNGQTVKFKTTKGRMRAKKFLTQVGLSGVYETFRLDSDTFDIKMKAVGGAVTADFERLLDGSEDLAQLLDIILETMTDAAFLEVQKALRSALTNSARPAANVVTSNMFESEKMMKLISVAKSYGSSAAIFAPPEFVADMGADAIVPVGASYQGIYSPGDIEAIHNTGYINLFRGTPVIQIPQSFVDENNEETWIDPQLAYVLPTGGEKVVKLGFEGGLELYDRMNRDNSIEINAYRKMGTAILTQHNWCIYQNTGIAQTMKGA